MLRTIFVIGIVLVGLFYAAQSPFYALMFYLWLAYFRPETWLWTNFLSQFNLSFIVGGFLLLASLPSIGNFRFTWRVTLIMLFLMQSVVSLLLAEHPDFSTPFWIEFLKVAVISIVITFLVSDERKYRITLLVLAFSLGFEMVKQGWAQLILNPGATNANQHPALGDNNGVAVGVFMLVPVFVALAQTTKSKWRRYGYQLAIVGLAYRGISTYSRGGLIAGGVLALIMLWRSPRKIRALISTAAIVFVIASVMPPDYWDRMNTIRAPEENRDSSAQGRLHFWHVAVLMAQAKPLTGVGFSGFRASFPTYNDEPEWGNDRAAHSSWFGTLADMGYPGELFFVASLAGALFACSRIKKKAKERGQKNVGIYATTMQATLLVYMAGATFLTMQYLEMLWHMVALSIALERIQAEMPQQSAVVVGRPAPLPQLVAQARV